MIVAIGVLGALVFSTYAGVRRNQHNQQRQTDIQAIYKQLESYYVVNSDYPTLADINSPAWRATNMKALSSAALRDPSSKSDLLVAEPTAKAYSYDVTAADGSDCNNQTRVCAHYTLTATLEGRNAGTYVKSSLN